MIVTAQTTSVASVCREKHAGIEIERGCVTWHGPMAQPFSSTPPDPKSTTTPTAATATTTTGTTATGFNENNMNIDILIKSPS